MEKDEDATLASLMTVIHNLIKKQKGRILRSVFYFIRVPKTN